MSKFTFPIISTVQKSMSNPFTNQCDVVFDFATASLLGLAEEGARSYAVKIIDFNMCRSWMEKAIVHKYPENVDWAVATVLANQADLVITKTIGTPLHGVDAAVMPVSVSFVKYINEDGTNDTNQLAEPFVLLFEDRKIGEKIREIYLTKFKAFETWNKSTVEEDESEPGEESSFTVVNNMGEDGSHVTMIRTESEDLETDDDNDDFDLDDDEDDGTEDDDEIDSVVNASIYNHQYMVG